MHAGSGVRISAAGMPALMDSAVLLAADGPPLRVAAKALHPLEASGQLADTAAPTPTASGTLEDWQVTEVLHAVQYTRRHASVL